MILIIFSSIIINPSIILTTVTIISSISTMITEPNLMINLGLNTSNKKLLNYIPIKLNPNLSLINKITSNLIKTLIPLLILYPYPFEEDIANI